MREQRQTGGYIGSGQTWTLPDAYNIALDVYPPLSEYGRADRASSAATSHALQLGATDLEYEVTRVKSPVIGRDMNPMGRGDGAYYANGGNVMSGSLRIGAAKPSFYGELTFGFGSSVNNEYHPHCHEVAIATGRCFPGPGAPDSCCNPNMEEEAWKSVWGGYGAYRACVDDSLNPPYAVPGEFHPCRPMGEQWMQDCWGCVNPGQDDGGGDEEEYCEQYPSASEVQPPGTPPGSEQGGYQGAEPVGGAVTFWTFPTGFTWKECAGVLWPRFIMDGPIGPILPPIWPPPSPEPTPWNSRFPGCSQEQIDALTRGLHSALMGVETKECCEMLPERWAKKIMDCMREKILTHKITCLRPGDKYYKRCLEGYTAFVVSGRVYVCPGTLKESQLGGSLACQLAGTLAEELAHVCGLADPGLWQETVGRIFGLPTAGDYGACIERACYIIAGVKGGVL